MTNWFTKIAVGEGNAIRDRSFTNWNTFDAGKVVAEKAKSSSITAPVKPAAKSNGDVPAEKE
ncbi:MAG: hypothetical protein ACREMY_18775 [bacterium]